MRIVKAEALKKIVAGNVLFENVDIEIHSGQRIALIGLNGSGKTTLLNSLIGETQLDAGKVIYDIPRHDWGWMEPTNLYSELSVMDAVFSSLPDVYRVKKEMEYLQSELKQDSSETILLKYTDIMEIYSSLNGYEWESKVEKLLRTLEFPPALWDLPVSMLSGGQKTRIQLARAIVNDPPFLILDEPTNHLDQRTLEWLENWLVRFSGACLFVSHDRQFIDNVAQFTYELASLGTKKYVGGYTAYRKQKGIEIKTLQSEMKKQSERRKQLQESISRFRQWFGSTTSEAGQRKHSARIHAKEKEIERLDKQNIHLPAENSGLNMQLSSSSFEAKTLLTIEKLDFSYPYMPMFSKVNLSIQRGDRIAMLGPNGSGKTTLLRLMVGELAPSAGVVTHNPQLRVGYLAQEVEGLKMNTTILDHILSIPHMTETEARTMLACFMFKREEVYKPMKDLSMGERCRVAFLRLYFSGANFLVLDEPSNYLDIDTREQIEEALLLFPGAFIVVSHDRYMIEKLANRLVFIENGTVESYNGTLNEYQHSDSIVEDPLKRNTIKEIELKLIDLINRDETDPERQGMLLEQIKLTRNELDRLKESI